VVLSAPKRPKQVAYVPPFLKPYKYLACAYMSCLPETTPVFRCGGFLSSDSKMNMAKIWCFWRVLFIQISALVSPRPTKRLKYLSNSKYPSALPRRVYVAFKTSTEYRDVSRSRTGHLCGELPLLLGFPLLACAGWNARRKGVGAVVSHALSFSPGEYERWTDVGFLSLRRMCEYWGLSQWQGRPGHYVVLLLLV